MAYRIPLTSSIWRRFSRGLLSSRASRRSLLTESRSHGPTDPPLLELTVPAHFESIVNRYGSRTAVYSRHQGQRLSYEKLDEQSNALARALQKFGVSKGDRVAVSLGNNAEYAIVVSALNHLAASHLIIGLETNLSRRPPSSNISLIASLLGSLEKKSPVETLKGLIFVDNVKKDPREPAEKPPVPNHPALMNFKDLISSETGFNGPPTPDSPLRNTDVVNIQFTSGTTSMPKAAQLAHRSILNNGYGIGARMLLRPEDVVICTPPLFHCFGCILGYMATATHGSSIVFPTEAFDPMASLLAVQEEKGTALYGVPTMFHAMLELIATGAVEKKGFEHLRTGIAAGSVIPSALMSKLHQILNLKELTICYGMTETSPVSCMTTTDDPMEMRLDSVGRTMPHVEVRVVDTSDRNKILPVGERGELVVSGYLVMAGYYGDKQKTDEVLVEEADERGQVKRWMHTGDEAEMTPDGYVKITGRIKDLIIRGGENIHPLEVENCILQHEDVLDVSVIGVRDERYGEAVAAFVISKLDSPLARSSSTNQETAVENIKNFVRERMSRHLVPKHVFFVDNFPKTASGKVQKYVLRDGANRMLKSRA